MSMNKLNEQNSNKLNQDCFLSIWQKISFIDSMPLQQMLIYLNNSIIIIKRCMSYYYLLNQYTVYPTYQTFQHNYAPLEVFVNQNINLWPELQNSAESVNLPNQRPEQKRLEVKQKKSEKLRKKVKKTKRKNKEKQIQSAKKNSQSNIVNQLFAYFNTPQKSAKVVQRAIKLLGRSCIDIEKVRSIFYNIVRLIHYKRERKYKNKQTIKQYYESSEFIRQIPEIRQKLSQISIFTLDEFCTVFRIATYHYVKYISISAVLTSKRITTSAKKLHLIRRRIVLERLQENCS